MKKILFIGMILATMLTMCNVARAETEELFQNGTLCIISGETKCIPNVPKGLTASDARKLVTGEKETVVIKDGFGKIISSTIDFPSAKVHKEYSDKIVEYSKGEWFVSTAPNRLAVENASDIAIFFLWIPALLILGMSFSEHLSDILMFYASMFASASLGLLPGEVFGGILAGGFGGMFAAAAGCIFRAEEVNMFAIAGMGAMVGAAGGVFTGNGLKYFTFLFIVCLASFAIGQIVQIECAAKKKTEMKTRGT